MFKLSTRSLNNLKGVNENLVKVVKRAIEITEVDFIVTEGLRTRERQRELVAKGASRTMNSMHLTGRAVDVVAYVNGKVTYDYPYMKRIAEAFKKAASELGISITWGGDWKSFVDTPHFQLD